MAESCTGGAVCSTLTGLPECGKPLEQGFITYTKAAKVRALGIDSALLDKYGLISAECAKAMAEGARNQGEADFGVGITGVAGPDTAENQPVGLVFISCASSEETQIQRYEFGDVGRNVVRQKAVAEALKLLRESLSLSIP